jgi:hypothetical protein
MRLRRRLPVVVVGFAVLTGCGSSDGTSMTTKAQPDPKPAKPKQSVGARRPGHNSGGLPTAQEQSPAPTPTEVRPKAEEPKQTPPKGGPAPSESAAPREPQDGSTDVQQAVQPASSAGGERSDSPPPSDDGDTNRSHSDPIR